MWFVLDQSHSVPLSASVAHSLTAQVSAGNVTGRAPAVALIEEGEEQEDEADVLVVTEALSASTRSAGQGHEGQGALVRNILEAEKALQVRPCLVLLEVSSRPARQSLLS